MNTKTPLYYNNALVSENDYSELSETFKLPYDVVAEVIGQIEDNGEPTWPSYTGTVRERIRSLHQALSLAPTELDPIVPSNEEIIVDHAAISLIQAMTASDENNFLINEEGFCTINPSSPPTLEKSYQMVAQVIQLRELGPKMEDKTSWMLGSIVDELETLHGAAFEMSQVCKETEKSYNTVWTAVQVYRRFKKKHYKLSFTHHKEAMFQKIGDESQNLILHKAETYGLGAKSLRELGSIIRTMEDDQVVRNIRSTKQAEDLIAAYRQNKVTYLVYDDGEWSEVKGVAETVPEGRVVIDLKNKTARANNGDPILFKSCQKKTKN